jgi:hypothetical protein
MSECCKCKCECKKVVEESSKEVASKEGMFLSRIKEHEDRKLFQEMLTERKGKTPTLTPEPELKPYSCVSFPEYYKETLKLLYAVLLQSETSDQTQRVNMKITTLYRMRKKYVQDSIKNGIKNDQNSASYMAK